ncbi:MAG: hypothetical protein ACFB10_14570 [Salibacteraceae bacterium]
MSRRSLLLLLTLGWAFVLQAGEVNWQRQYLDELVSIDWPDSLVLQALETEMPGEAFFAQATDSICDYRLFRFDLPPDLLVRKKERLSEAYMLLIDQVAISNEGMEIWEEDLVDFGGLKAWAVSARFELGEDTQQWIYFRMFLVRSRFYIFEALQPPDFNREEGDIDYGQAFFSGIRFQENLGLNDQLFISPELVDASGNTREPSFPLKWILIVVGFVLGAGVFYWRSNSARARDEEGRTN